MRTQNDFCLKGGITAHSDNKTRLNRLICVYNGRYARKQDETRLKMYIYAISSLKVYIYALKSAKSAAILLIPTLNSLSLNLLTNV